MYAILTIGSDSFLVSADADLGKLLGQLDCPLRDRYDGAKGRYVYELAEAVGKAPRVAVEYVPDDCIIFPEAKEPEHTTETETAA